MTTPAEDFEVTEVDLGIIPEPPPEAVEILTDPEHGQPQDLLSKTYRLARQILPGASPTPRSRGWGTPSASYGQTNIVRVSGRNITVYVHREVAVLFGHLLVDLDDHLRTKGRSLARKADDWGYAHRYIAGTTVWSNHAWGLAVDFDAIDNPQGRYLVTEFSPGFIDWLLKTKYKGLFRWGGRYGGTTKKDAMHFEFMGSITDARSLTRTLANDNLAVGDTPVLTLKNPLMHGPKVSDVHRAFIRIDPGNHARLGDEVDRAVWGRKSIAVSEDYKKHRGITEVGFGKRCWARIRTEIPH